MISKYNNRNELISYNTGRSGGNPGGQADVRGGEGHDLSSNEQDRLRDVGRSEVTAPQKLHCLTGSVGANNLPLFSAVDSVISNEVMRIFNAETGIVRPQASSSVDSPDEKG